MTNPTALVSKLWNDCSILRDDEPVVWRLRQAAVECKGGTGSSGQRQPAQLHLPAVCDLSKALPRRIVMSDLLTAERFFTAWQSACDARKANLLEKWTSGSLFTAEVFDAPNALVCELAERLGGGLKVYAGYYSIDAIFFKDQDRVHCALPGQTWVQNIRIAFEHENYFNSGLFTETSHLLITRAELRVLVSYPGNDSELAVELEKLAQIICASGLAESSSFLFIAGDRINNLTDIRWRGFAFCSGSFQQVNP